MQKAFSDDYESSFSRVCHEACTLTKLMPLASHTQSRKDAKDSSAEVASLFHLLQRGDQIIPGRFKSAMRILNPRSPPMMVSRTPPSFSPPRASIRRATCRWEGGFG